MRDYCDYSLHTCKDQNDYYLFYYIFVSEEAYFSCPPSSFLVE